MKQNILPFPSRRDVVKGALAGAVVLNSSTPLLAQIEGDENINTLTIQDLWDTIGVLMARGVDPSTPVATFVDGRPDVLGSPAILRKVTFTGGVMCSQLASRLHLQRHVDPSSILVVGIG